MEFYCNFEAIFNKIKKVQTYVVISMFRLLCEFVVVSKYDEMNCNFVFGFFGIIL
jgi:hypothetical protein